MAKKARPGAHSKSEPATDAQKQVYDNVLKRLVEKQADSVIPLLLGPLATEVVEELNIEMLIPPRRSDRAYMSFYQWFCRLVEPLFCREAWRIKLDVPAISLYFLASR
jgi:hypothetical protein